MGLGVDEREMVGLYLANMTGSSLCTSCLTCNSQSS